MVVPDLEQICEIMLFSEGFDSAKLLAKKMTVLYKLSREQLSKQHHYDFGLRALKSVLVMAGSLKRGAPEMSEQLVLMRALRDMNLPKVSSIVKCNLLLSALSNYLTNKPPKIPPSVCV